MIKLLVHGVRRRSRAARTRFGHWSDRASSRPSDAETAAPGRVHTTQGVASKPDSVPNEVPIVTGASAPAAKDGPVSVETPGVPKEPDVAFSAFTFLTTLFSSADVRAGDLMLDVGAQRGQFSRAFAALGFEVFAFEASPPNYEELVKIVEPFTSITTVNRAVMDVDTDEVPFYFSSEFIGINSLKLNSSHLNEDEFALVEGVRLASFLGERASAVRVIKTDIEGADLLALKGFDLAEHQPELILSEYGGRSAAFGYSAVDLVEYVSSFGYEAWCSNYESGTGLPYSAATGVQASVQLKFFGRFAECESPNWGDVLFFKPHWRRRLQAHTQRFSFGDAQTALR